MRVSQFTTALVPTVSLLASFDNPLYTIAKVRETFWLSFVLIHSMIGKLLSEVDGRVGHGLDLSRFESCVLCLVFLDSFLQSTGQEKHFWYLIYPSTLFRS